MIWRRLGIVAAVGITAVGCNLLGGGGEEAADTTSTAAQVATETPVQDTAAAPTEQPAAQPAPRQPAPPPVSRPQRTATLVDEPWMPIDTGAVDPGMMLDQVVGVWGEPVAQRAIGEWTYLYFRNGCEFSCGTFDVVLLQGGQVVDAVVRGPGHTYTGVSSSPAGRAPEPTLPPGTESGPAD